MSTDRWIVGPEYESALLERLRKALKSLGYHVENKWAGVAGSQDIQHWGVAGPYGNLVVEVETYVGISISGSSELVSAVRQAFEQPLAANHSLKADHPDGRRP